MVLVRDLSTLHKVSLEIKDIKEAKFLSDKLLAYMEEASNCLGVSAIQLGIDRRICAVKIGKGKDPIVMLNPRIVDSSGTVIKLEGCMSRPYYRYKQRSKFVTVEYERIYGKRLVRETMELRDKYARTVQHEIDHMNGITIDTDRFLVRGILRNPNYKRG